MPRISFSVEDIENGIIEHEAASRGLTRAQFVKMTTFAYINKSPSKGVFSFINRLDEDGNKTAYTPNIVGSDRKIGRSQ